MAIRLAIDHENIGMRLRKSPCRRSLRCFVETLEERAVPSVLAGSGWDRSDRPFGHKQSDHSRLTNIESAARRAQRVGAAAHPDAYSYPVGYQPEQIRSAYGINSIRFGSSKADGSGQTIAIVDAYNDPDIVKDVDAFDKKFSLTANGSTIFKKYGPASQFLTVVNQRGQTIKPARG